MILDLKIRGGLIVYGTGGRGYHAWRMPESSRSANLPRRSVFGGDLLEPAEKIIHEGGYISTGTGDYGYVECGRPTNAALVRWTADLSHSLGRTLRPPKKPVGSWLRLARR